MKKLPSYATNGSGIHYYWLNSIEAVSAESWETCFDSNNVFHSYGFARALERSKFKGMEFHYLAGDRDGKTVFLLPCFCYRASSAVLASPTYRRLAKIVHRVVPGLLDYRLFVAGSPLTLTHHFGLQQISRNERVQVLCEVREAMLRRCTEVNAQVVVIKEFEKSWLPELREVFEPKFLIVEGLPTTYVPISYDGSPSYRERLRSSYRRKLKQRQRHFEKAGLRWEALTDFGRYANELHDLYQQVLERSASQFTILTPAFFHEIPENLGDRAYAIVAYDGDQAVAFLMLLRDKDWLHFLRLGLNYEYRDHARLYNNCLYRFISECEQRGYPVADFGQTTYEVKGQLGAVISRRYLCVYHRNQAMRWVIRVMKSQLFPARQMPKYRVFSDTELANKILSTRNLQFERTID
ncbi:GNAT family N-acetyltransferase [Thermodesulfobacteriota bacterium]